MLPKSEINSNYSLDKQLFTVYDENKMNIARGDGTTV
jgi:hypothetical protein